MKKNIITFIMLIVALFNLTSCANICLHDWASATCQSPETCTKCAATRGDVGSHDWTSATCTAPKTCTACSQTSGTPLGHSVRIGTCPRCHQQSTVLLPQVGTIISTIDAINSSLSSSMTYIEISFSYTSSLYQSTYVELALAEFLECVQPIIDCANLCKNYPEFVGIEEELNTIIVAIYYWFNDGNGSVSFEGSYSTIRSKLIYLYSDVLECVDNMLDILETWM